MTTPTRGLAVEDVTVRFGGLLALDAVSLDAPPGQVTGLIGPNGAGKTTLFNVLCGLQRAAQGDVRLDGVALTGLATHQRARRGLARTFQRLETFTLLTVRENVLAGAEFRRRWARVEATPDEIADQLLARLDLGDVADARVDTLPTGRARIVEVARALASAPTMLLLDEPSSGLDAQETAALGEVLREVAATGPDLPRAGGPDLPRAGGPDLPRAGGPGILLVEHDMALVMSVCEHVTVLDFGSVIARGTPEEIRADPAVQTAYLGEDTSERRRTPSQQARATGAAHTRPAIEVTGLRAGYGEIDVLDGVDLTVAAGEVLAVLGPNGAGKTTLLDAVAGLVPTTSGHVSVLGHDVTRAPADALARAGLCLIPEGRGVFPNLTVSENLWLVSNAGVARRDVEALAYQQFPQLAERRGQLAGSLSGGEQQMLAMARALTCDPAVLLLDELSMGLAPVVVRSLYDEVRRLAEGGLTILVVEQFAHEILEVADRAAIMLHGRLDAPSDPNVVAEQLARAYLTGTSA